MKMSVAAPESQDRDEGELCNDFAKKLGGVKERILLEICDWYVA
jgi:hypothetical protein